MSDCTECARLKAEVEYWRENYMGVQNQMQDTKAKAIRAFKREMGSLDFVARHHPCGCRSDCAASKNKIMGLLVYCRENPTRDDYIDPITRQVGK